MKNLILLTVITFGLFSCNRNCSGGIWFRARQCDYQCTYTDNYDTYREIDCSQCTKSDIESVEATGWNCKKK